MAFATRLPTVRYQSEHFNERTWMCYHQAPPLVRVVALVGDAGQAKPHLEHNPLSLLGACHTTPIRKLNDPGHRGSQWQRLCGFPILRTLMDWEDNGSSGPPDVVVRSRRALLLHHHNERCDSATE